MSRRRVIAAVVTVACAAIAAGCGVTRDKAARPIEQIPFGVTDSTTTSTTEAPPPTTAATTTTLPAPTTTATTIPTETITLYFATADRVRRVERAIAVGAPGARLDANTVVRELYTAPTGLDTLVRADLANVLIDRGRAIVALGPAFFTLSPPPQLAIAAQLVLTLTDRPGIGRVAFVDLEGQPVPVPRADGLTGDEVAYDDYRALILP